jgi:GT2 family glycosyltransferase
MSAHGLSICICTKGRYALVERCLQSIFAGKAFPTAVLVSDDADDSDEMLGVQRAFPQVVFLRGPKRGLCANRNHVIRHVRTEYLSLVDDDAVLGNSFVSGVFALLPELQDKVVVTGDLIEDDVLLSPSNPSFWGYFAEPPTLRNETIHLNSNVFPSKAFSQVRFDEKIAYGYEDMDVCSQLLALGYEIRHEPALVNYHVPPATNFPVPKSRELQRERARFYTSVRRYFIWEKKWVKGCAYVLLAPLHRIGHALKMRDPGDIPHCVADTVFALRGLSGLRENQTL